MEHKTLFRPFRRRLLMQVLLRACLVGLSAGAGAVFLASLVYHILILPTDPKIFTAVFLAAFTLGVLPVLIFCYPTDKRVAERLDQTGLQERAGTMLAFRQEEGLLPRLQREDAASHIRQTLPKKLRTPLPRKILWSCLLSLILCGAMLLLPHDIFAPVSAEDPQVDAHKQQVTELIEDLRQQVRDAELAKELEEELLALLDQLEQDLLEARSKLDQAVLIEQAKQAMSEMVSLSLTRFAIGQALMEFELTSPLGAQISGDDPLSIEEPMDALEAHVTANTRHLTRLSSNLISALENSGVDSADLLYEAFLEFSDNLDGLFKTLHPKEETAPEPSDDGKIPAVFDHSEQAILYALGEQAHLESEIEDTTNMISEGLDSLLGDKLEAQKPSGTPDSGGGSQGGTGSNGDSQSDFSGTILGGMGDGTSNSTRDTMLEGIYDPISGSVSYGEVFAAYYAEYLAALDNGEIPDDLRPYFERYYSALS